MEEREYNLFPKARLVSRLNRFNPVPVHQRLYVATHPLGLLFSLGVALQGALYLLFPHIFIATAATSALSPTILYLFNATWLVGGSLSILGIGRGLRKAEAVGMSLLGGGFSAYYAILVQAIPYGWATGTFIAFLALACFLRVRHVARTGYVTMEVVRNPTDRPAAEPGNAAVIAAAGSACL